VIARGALRQGRRIFDTSRRPGGPAIDGPPLCATNTRVLLRVGWRPGDHFGSEGGGNATGLRMESGSAAAGGGAQDGRSAWKPANPSSPPSLSQTMVSGDDGVRARRQSEAADMALFFREIARPASRLDWPLTTFGRHRGSAEPVSRWSTWSRSNGLFPRKPPDSAHFPEGRAWRGRLRPLTDDPAFEPANPAWSPDRQADCVHFGAGTAVFVIFGAGRGHKRIWPAGNSGGLGAGRLRNPS